MTPTDLLPCVELEPVGEARACVLWLHGLGADGHDFEPVAPLLGMQPEHGVRFVFPHAPKIPVTINGGMVMPAWYDITGMGPGSKGDEPGVRRSARQLADLIAREVERGIPTERIVLAGFSQGGVIALFQGLRHPERLAGIMALSTYMPVDGELDTERSDANAGIPILQAHGSLDPMVPYEAGIAARDRVQGLGHRVEWHEYPMGHQVCPEELDAIGVWLRGVLPPA